MKKTVELEIWREGKFIIAHCIDPEITTQGLSVKETLFNIKEAIDLYFEDKKEEIPTTFPHFSIKLEYHPARTFPLSIINNC